MQILSPHPQAIYSGVRSALSRISTTEGISALWRGVNSVILGAGPSHALHFATYEYCKEKFCLSSNEHNFLGTGISHLFSLM
jgi:hypothetical protein